MRIVLEVHGEEQINRRFLRWQSAAVDASPVWAVVYAYLLGVEQKQFDSQGAASGSQWVELAASTIAEKARKGLRPEVLRATDELMSSLTRPDDPNQLKVVTPGMFAFGSMLPYAKLHQTGTATMPQRRPIDLSEAHKRTIVRAIQLWLARGVAPLIRV